MASKTSITKVCTKTGFKVTGTPDEVAEFFYRDKSTKDGFATWCKAAEKSYNTAYHKALKKAEADRKRDIANEAGLTMFGRTMKSERVKRGTFSNRKAKDENAKDASAVKADNKQAVKKATGQRKAARTFKRTNGSARA